MEVNLNCTKGENMFKCTSANQDIWIYETSFRMNHSCCPNVVWSYSSENPLLKEVRAVKEIVAGEELCPNYINSFEVIGLFLIIKN